MNKTPRFDGAVLTTLTRNLFHAAGLDEDKAQRVAELLVLTDMMGRHTHGLALCPLYLDQIAQGLMTCSGQPDVIRDTGSTIVWDGRYLPGLWLVDQALNLAFERLPEHGVVTFAMRRSHHIACLASLVKQAVDRGYLAILASSDPAFEFVAPHGGREAVFTPNPFAIGYPGTRTPVLVDICASITTVSMVRQKVASGQTMDNAWLLDGAGVPSQDPRVMEQTDPRGSIMLLGGLEYGHKGFGLALMVEALTQGLSGFGRKDSEKRWSGSVYLQVVDPDAFAGHEAFIATMDDLTARCHASAPIDAERPVRMPGEQTSRNIAQAHEEGVQVAPEVIARLREWAQRLRVPAPL
ncbi:MAG: Ldh family oxidoreductase [Rhodocyclaceae bacterium]